MLFGITTEWRSASHRNRVHLRPDSPLRAVRDPVVVEEVVRTCHPSAAPFDPLALEALKCLAEVASYGDGGRDVGATLLIFLGSENGAERSYAITDSWASRF
jgi:hypothetical protein